MATKGRIIVSLVLRIFTILFTAGCIVVLILDKFTDADGFQVATLKTFIAYRYVLVTASIAAVYCLLQLPFTTYRACTGKRLISGAFLPYFYYYGDQVVAFILASGVGAGFLVTVQLKAFTDGFPPLEDFFDKELIATGLLTGAFLCMATLSMFSTRPQIKESAGNKGFFFR